MSRIWEAVGFLLAIVWFCLTILPAGYEGDVRSPYHCLLGFFNDVLGRWFFLYFGKWSFFWVFMFNLPWFIEILAGLTGWIGFNVLSRYEASFVAYIVIQGVRSQSSDRLCPTNVNTYLFTYVVYANRNRIVALASIEPAGEIKTWNSCHACPAFSEFHPPHSMPMPRPFIGNTTQQSCQRLKLGSIQHACRAVGGWNSRIIAPLLLGGFITIKVTRCLENTHVWGPYDTIFSVVMFWVCAGSPVAGRFRIHKDKLIDKYSEQLPVALPGAQVYWSRLLIAWKKWTMTIGWLLVSYCKMFSEFHSTMPRNIMKVRW